MTESRKIVWKQTAAIAIGEVLGIGVMFGIYALLHKLAWPVILGGIVGALLAIGNFFFMAVVATIAADKAQNQDVEGGVKLMKSAYPIRLLVLAGVLFVCAASKTFDVLALALPLLFVRPVILLQEFFTKRGG